MLKHCPLVLTAAGLISIAPPFAGAQESPSNGQQSSASQDHGGSRRFPPDPAQRTKELTRELNLSSDQQVKVQDIFAVGAIPNGQFAPGHLDSPARSPRQDDGDPQEDQCVDTFAPRLCAAEEVGRNRGQACTVDATS